MGIREKAIEVCLACADATLMAGQHQSIRSVFPDIGDATYSAALSAWGVVAYLLGPTAAGMYAPDGSVYLEAATLLRDGWKYGDDVHMNMTWAAVAS
jgi:hypothetical protein